MKTQAIEKLIERLSDVKPAGPGKWIARCPAHDDKTPSLSIATADDGRVLIKCHAGCEAAAVVQAVGLKLADLFPEREKKSEAPKKTREPLPPGRYVCRLAKVEDDKKDGGEKWKIRWRVCAGVHKGDLIFDSVSPSGQSAARLRSFAKAVGLDTTGVSNLTHELVLGRTATVEVIEGTRKDGKPWTRVSFNGYAPADETAYDYRDEKGALLYQVVRFRPKAFLQRRPNGKGGWNYTLEKVRRVLYRMPELLAAPREKIRWWVEGEKDVDRLWSIGLVATTTAQGASAFDSTDVKALEYLTGADVVILPDNDDAGRAYAGRVAKRLEKIARSVKVIKLPNVAEKGDVSDWLDQGGTREELDRICSDPTLLEEATVDAPRRFKVSNFREDKEEDAEGKEQTVYHRLPIGEIVAGIFFGTDGWPKRLGVDLFYDREGTLAILDTESSLFAYLHSVADVSWRRESDSKGLNYVTRGELMEQLRLLAEQKHEVSEHPLHPPPKGVHILQKNPKSDSVDGSYLRNLLAGFRAASEEDAAILQALALTPFWGGMPGKRPLFVITGKEGIGLQSIGKSTVAEVLANLCGGHVALKLPRGDAGDDLAKQLVSDVAMRRRVALLDNVSGTLASDELAQLITSQTIVGRPAFGRQRERSNYLTWVATAVMPTLSEDLTKRSVVLELAEPDRDRAPTFREDVEKFVMEHMQRLVLEALLLLRGACHQILSKHSRFPSWDSEVLATHPAADSALSRIHSRQGDVDDKSEEIEGWVECLADHVATHFKQNHFANIPPRLAAKLWNEANINHYSVRHVGRVLRQARRAGQLPAWVHEPVRRGAPWIVNVPEATQRAEGDAGPSGPAARADLF